MKEVLARYAVLSQQELESKNPMMQHRRKCKAQRRNQMQADLNISKAVFLGKRTHK